jgi:predicted nucleic acid-binding protein
MNVFIDTNVVVDFLGRREGFFDNAAMIFQMQKEGRINAIVSSLTIINCAYILRKVFSREVMLDKVEKLCKTFKISAIDKTILVEALERHPYDFEDAVQYISALPYKPDIIITRDKHGFVDLDVLIMTPDEFIAECQKQ